MSTQIRAQFKSGKPLIVKISFKISENWLKIYKKIHLSCLSLPHEISRCVLLFYVNNNNNNNNKKKKKKKQKKKSN